MFPDVRLHTFEKIGLSRLDEVATAALSSCGSEKIWLFQGGMGAGKTTFIKSLCKELKVTDVTGSPTFSIVNEYLAGHNEKIFHFDFYRIRHEAEAYEIGVDEYFYSGHYCFVEWPEKIPSLLPDRYVEVKITMEDAEHRTIAISIHDGEEENGV